MGCLEATGRQKGAGGWPPRAHFSLIYACSDFKGKINELATNSKNKNIRDLYRGINGFKRATSLNY
jgi:hypothetical protein